MKIHKLLIIMLIAVSPQLLLAQPPLPFEDGPMREKVRERINTMKVWKLTEAVGLTPEQSEKFFPVYNKHWKKMDEIMNHRGELVVRLEELIADPKSSESEIREKVAELTSFPQQMMEEQNRFYKEVSAILPLRQQAKLVVFEERFRQQLQEIVRDIRHERRGKQFNDE